MMQKKIPVFSEKQDFSFLLWSNMGAVKRDVRVGICMH